MMDIVEKNGDKINTAELAKQLGCKVVEISALKNKGIMEAAEAAIDAAKNSKTIPMHSILTALWSTLLHILKKQLYITCRKNSRDGMQSRSLKEMKKFLATASRSDKTVIKSH